MKDTVRVYLREPYFPFTVVDSSKALIDSVLLEGSFRTLVAPGSYYIVVKHRNSIETWSSAPVYIEATAMSYDFTLFAAQAYGNNLVLNGNNYCLYGGDVNQDGIVDAGDGSMTDNDANNFVTGYAQTDLTGDRFVDGSDNTIADNNASAFVSVITPLSYQPPCNLTCARFFTWSGFTWCVMTSDGTKMLSVPIIFRQVMITYLLTAPAICTCGLQEGTGSSTAPSCLLHKQWDTALILFTLQAA
ncbi:MAG: hypothetical protein IPG02_17425 [Ignavibacteria bacterium]|nr:hypothetical protein [Ignavibacteria bacterium]